MHDELNRHISTVIAANKAVAMTTLQKPFIAAVLVAAVPTGIYEGRLPGSFHRLL
jgi:hypothetical protein